MALIRGGMDRPDFSPGRRVTIDARGYVLIDGRRVPGTDSSRMSVLYAMMEDKANGYLPLPGFEDAFRIAELEYQNYQTQLRQEFDELMEAHERLMGLFGME